MKKLTLILTGFLCSVLPLWISSCDDSKTYAEQLEEEEEYIRLFMNKHEFVTTENIPDTVPWIDANNRRLFYKTEDGLYIHVLDTGLSVGTIKKNTLVCVRYTEMSVKGDSVTYSNMNSSYDPVEINYGTVYTGGSYTSSYYWGDCEAWHKGLDYVGDYGHVMMIVPSDLGMPAYMNSNTELLAHYYELCYTFWR